MSYPRIYNAAVDMVDRNVAQGRASKPVFIDANETLTYGELQARCNRMANLLATYAIPREARVALLLLDTVDFPVAFWGAIKAGVIPVALNTLLTTEQYAYMLGDSRAKALFVSAPLLPVVQPILGQLPFLKHIFVSGGEAPPFALSLRGELQHQAPDFEAADTCADETAFWLYSSGSTGMPKGALPRALEPDGDGAAVRPGLPRRPRGRSRLFGGQAVLRLRARQRHVVSDVGRRYQHLVPERPTPEVVFRTLKQHQATVFFGVPTLYSAMLAYPQGTPDNCSQRLRLCVSAGEALPAEVGKAFTDKFGVEILDGVGSTEMLHQYVCNRPGKVRYGTSGQAIPGYEIRLVDEQGKDVARRRSRRDAGARLQRRRRLLEPARQEPLDLRGRLDPLRRQVHPRRRRLLHLPGPHRRHVQGVRHLGVTVRGGERAGRPRRRAGGRGGAEGGQRRAPQADGLHRPEARQDRRQRPRGSSQGAGQGQGRPMEVSTLDQAGRQPAQDRHRQDPALQAARSCARAICRAAKAIRHPQGTTDNPRLLPALLHQHHLHSRSDRRRRRRSRAPGSGTSEAPAASRPPGPGTRAAPPRARPSSRR